MEPQVPRISLTLPAINAARRGRVPRHGGVKAQAVARVFGPDPDLGAARGAGGAGRGSLTVLLDEAAAAKL